MTIPNAVAVAVAIVVAGQVKGPAPTITHRAFRGLQLSFMTHRKWTHLLFPLPLLFRPFSLPVKQIEPDVNDTCETISITNMCRFGLPTANQTPTCGGIK